MTIATLAASLAATPSPRRLSRIKSALFVACLLPLAAILATLLAGRQVNPIEYLTRELGEWTLNLLLITLAVSPLRWLGAPGWIVRLRRMLGLFAFGYGCLHLASYLWLDQFFDWAAIWRDIVKRPFITVGMAAMLLMTPLAITSSDRWQRRLKRNWSRLHRLVYPLAILAVLHYYWLVKRDLATPLAYAAVLALLLGWRLWQRWPRRVK